MKNNLKTLSIEIIVAIITLAIGILGLLDSYEEWFIIFIIIGIVLLLFCHWQVSGLFKDIAESKGYSIEGLQLFIFILPIMGAVYVIALPNNNVKSNSGNKLIDNNELPEL